MTAAGSRAEPHFVLAHGFTQTARSWTNVEQLLHAEIPGCTTTAVDLPGHGQAPPNLAESDLWQSAGHLVEFGGSGIYVGYSMGGRVALHAALAHPDAVRALVLIGATAGIDSEEGRAERRATDARLAGRLEAIGVDDFLDEWLRQPLFAALTTEAAQVDDRRRNTASGLAASLRSAGTGSQQPLWHDLPRIMAPTLLLMGEHDTKFRDLGDRMAAAIPDSTLQVVSDAGHSTHLERPEATVDAIAAWWSGGAAARGAG